MTFKRHLLLYDRSNKKRNQFEILRNFCVLLRLPLYFLTEKKETIDKETNAQSNYYMYPYSI